MRCEIKAKVFADPLEDGDLEKPGRVLTLDGGHLALLLGLAEFKVGDEVRIVRAEDYDRGEALMREVRAQAMRQDEALRRVLHCELANAARDAALAQTKKDEETVGLLADIVDALFDNPTRAEDHGYKGALARAATYARLRACVQHYAESGLARGERARKVMAEIEAAEDDAEASEPAAPEAQMRILCQCGGGEFWEQQDVAEKQLVFQTDDGTWEYGGTDFQEVLRVEGYHCAACGRALTDDEARVLRAAIREGGA